MSRRAPGTVRRLHGFFREYTAGLDSRDFKRLFDRDAARAYAVLTREHSQEPEPKKGMRRFLFRARARLPRPLLQAVAAAAPAVRRLAGGVLLRPDAATPGSSTTRRRSASTSSSTRSGSRSASAAWSSSSPSSWWTACGCATSWRSPASSRRSCCRAYLPELAGYDFAHSYRTANEVGGDFYDLTPLPDGRLALMVADASGHGMAAGLVMAIANATWRTALDLDPNPERAIAMLNRTLCRTGTTRTFMSAFYGLLNPDTGEMEYVCAGHPFPLLRRAGGRTEELGVGGYPARPARSPADEPRPGRRSSPATSSSSTPTASPRPSTPRRGRPSATSGSRPPSSSAAPRSRSTTTSSPASTPTPATSR